VSAVRSTQMRRKSMVGTALLAFGIIAAVAFLVTGSLWILAAAAMACVVAVVLLCQVGRLLP
jgi:hypothetical protein